MGSSSHLSTFRRMIVVQATIPAIASAASVASLISAGLAAQGESLDHVAHWAVQETAYPGGGNRSEVALGHAIGALYSIHATGARVSHMTADTSILIGGVSGAITGAVFEVFLR